MLQAFDWSWFVFCLFFGLLCQAYCLYLNDYADEALDRNNQDYWLSGGSRVIPDGYLSGQQLYRGALWLAGILVLLGLVVVTADRPWMPLLVAAALVLG